MVETTDCAGSLSHCMQAMAASADYTFSPPESTMRHLQGKGLERQLLEPKT